MSSPACSLEKYHPEDPWPSEDFKIYERTKDNTWRHGGYFEFLCHQDLGRFKDSIMSAHAGVVEACVLVKRGLAPGSKTAACTKPVKHVHNFDVQ